MLDKILSFLPGWVTTSGAGLVIANAATGWWNHTMEPKEAIFQLAIGLIGIGLRRAIARIPKI